MSGLEVPGIVLGALPILISAIEHWRNLKDARDLYWHIRSHYRKCLHDRQYHETAYKMNLRELLMPLTENADEVARLVADPGGQGWDDAALQKRLEGRLQESYHLYQNIITEMNHLAREFSKELRVDEENIQKRLLLPEEKEQRHNKPLKPQPFPRVFKLPFPKEKLEYEGFRVNFSLGETRRNKLLDQLKECNERLEKLLRSSDRVSACQYSAPGPDKQILLMEKSFRKIARKARLVYWALKTSWQCSCQSHHATNLRMEHRTPAEACFEIVLAFIAPSCYEPLPWRWGKISCGEMPSCSAVHNVTTPATLAPPLCQPTPTRLPRPKASSSKSTVRQHEVSSALLKPKISEVVPNTFIDRKMELCLRSSDKDRVDCMGIISHDGQIFHVHPTAQDEEIKGDMSITLDHILSHDFKGKFTWRQRHQIAFLLASSVGQLQTTPWLQTAFCKGDLIFYPRNNDSQDLVYDEPFIRQDLSHDGIQPPSGGPLVNDFNFKALGILLLELCFRQRLEDQPERKKHRPNLEINAKRKVDVDVARKWAEDVSDEVGDAYAEAVKWCLERASEKDKSWRVEFVRNVVRPLEVGIEAFKSATSVK